VEKLLQRELSNVAKITAHPVKSETPKPTETPQPAEKLEIDDLLSQPSEIHRNHSIVARSKADSDLVELV